MGWFCLGLLAQLLGGCSVVCFGLLGLEAWKTVEAQSPAQLTRLSLTKRKPATRQVGSVSASGLLRRGPERPAARALEGCRSTHIMPPDSP